MCPLSWMDMNNPLVGQTRPWESTLKNQGKHLSTSKDISDGEKKSKWLDLNDYFGLLKMCP